MGQVYRRISAPYMPNATPDKTNTPSPYYAPGELGCTFFDQNTNREYLRVQVDSGATSGTGIGHSPLAGELAYWKNESPGQWIVTNDKNQCDLGPTAAPNRIAGIFAIAPTVSPNVNGSDGLPLMYMVDLVTQALAFPVQATGTIVVGAQASGNTAANTANAVSQASVGAAAAPTQQIGVWTSATIGAPGPANTAPCDVNIGFQE
jgi:hypothetical protein